MQKTSLKGIYARGKRGLMYLRRRIPAALRTAYPPGQTEIVRSLGTADLREAEARSTLELARILAEFAEKRTQLDLRRASLAARRIRKLSDEELEAVGRFWSHQVLANDEAHRQEGLDDEQFDELGAELTTQRAALGRMLAQGQTLGILPALKSFLHLCGLDFDPDAEQARRASSLFLRAVVKTADHQLARHRGDPVDTQAVAPAAPHPLHVVVPELAPRSASAPTWDSVFNSWRDHVRDRPRSTTIAYQTPWRDLRRFCGERRVSYPGAVTPPLMTAFVQSMRDRALAVDTINERLCKVRAVYKIAVGKHVLATNPAASTLGFRESSARRRRKRRLPFDASDLNRLFGSRIYSEHRRSQGQSGEASYWIPVLMYYTGARPEEIAGLALSDVCHDSVLGWYLDIVDRPSPTEDGDLFEDDAPAAEPTMFDDAPAIDAVPLSHCRTLKNGSSVRRVPVTQPLIDLGLLRYVEWVRAQGATVLFPTLKKDTHEKLSGAFSKFFGRYLRDVVGISDKRKVLYSFRHTMKDLLEAAEIPSKYLQRVLGHATGDGDVTDGYGSELPFAVVVRYFARVKFPSIPAQPWQPRMGVIRREKTT